jgi:hypothetical protein
MVAVAKGNKQWGSKATKAASRAKPAEAKRDIHKKPVKKAERVTTPNRPIRG